MNAIHPAIKPKAEINTIRDWDFLMAASSPARINLMKFPKIEPLYEDSQGDQGLQADYTD
jgi:hypothetical protein